MSTPDWANSATNPVLRLLADSGVALSPSAIVVNLNDRLKRPPSRSTVTRILIGLRSQELVERVEPGRAYYVLTDAGQSYVRIHLAD